MNSTIKLEIPANKATLQPPIGPILGQYGIPGLKFCQEFNEKTKHFENDIILSVKILQSRTPPKKILKLFWFINISKILQKLEQRRFIKIQDLYNFSFLLIIGLSSSLTPQKIYFLQNFLLRSLIKTFISSIQSMGINIIM